MWRLQRARALENGIFADGFRRRIDQIDAGHPEVDAALARSQTWAEQAHNLHNSSPSMKAAFAAAWKRIRPS